MRLHLTEDLVRRFAEYESGNGYIAWGALHIVLEDGNIEDKHVEFCITTAIEDGDTEGEALARLLLQMTKTQRKVLPERTHKVWADGGPP